MGGRWGDDEVLAVSVTARAVDGAATAAVSDAVARAFGLRPRQVRVVAGERSRTKVVELDGPPEGARTRLLELLGE